MPLVVGVTFRRVGKVYYFDPEEIELHEGDFVIAETARGVEFGEVVLEPRSIPEEELVAPLKKVVRVATGDDLEREVANRDREKHAFEVCERKVADHGLPMKLLEAEYAFDGSQVTFSFSADGRIDFRELVKDVAGALKLKVQLHQIGVRDEAKLIGGYGTCGRSLCCSTFLSSFDPISMKMAKDQSLFLNPAKFSGACGKLMCCLRYEHEFYKQAQKRLPAVGAIIPVERGRAKVIDVNVVSNVITVATEDDVQLHVHASQLNLAGLCRKHGVACNMTEQNCEPLRPDEELTGTPVDAGDEVIVDDDGDVTPAVADWPEPRAQVRPQPAQSFEPISLGSDEVAPVSMWRTPGTASPSQNPPKENAVERGNSDDKSRKSGQGNKGNGGQNRNRPGRRPHQPNNKQGNSNPNRRPGGGGQRRDRPNSEPKGE